MILFKRRQQTQRNKTSENNRNTEIIKLNQTYNITRTITNKTKTKQTTDNRKAKTEDNTKQEQENTQIIKLQKTKKNKTKQNKQNKQNIK